MSDLRLEKISLRNFKGIINLTIEPSGEDLDIFGDNASGKTTVFDAFLWLLFGKDSQNRQDFQIKTLMPSGEAKHGFEHEVEAVLSLNHVPIKLRKVYYERWTKHRGSAEKTFEGHTTDYFIDDVPVKKTEYADRITKICDETAFRLLTDPNYFNQVMKWQDRRTLLLEVCGDISDADVIASDKALAALPEILGDRSLEDHRKVIAAKRIRINKELERIPVRIDEVTQGLPEIESRPSDIEAELKKLRITAQEKHSERARIDAGGAVAEKTKELREAEGDLILIERRIRTDIGAGAEETEQERRLWQNRLDEADRLIHSRGQDVEQNEITLSAIKAKLESSRQAWHEINDRIFDDDCSLENPVCPTCGQNLPTEQVEDKRARALATFNRQKAEDLEANNAHGQQLGTQAGNIALKNEQLWREIAEAEESKIEIQQHLDALPTAVETAEPDYSADANWSETMACIQALKAEIERLKGGNAEALAAIDAEINQIKAEIERLTGEEAKAEQRAKGQERIEELKAREKELAAEYEELEKQLFLTEEFIRSKVHMLESKINERFQLARFKLFNGLVNGAVEECCETTFRGIPYSDLNNGARLNVGLDIINTLSDHYSFTAPIFVDNAEAVTALAGTSSQLVRLLVSAADKDLRVETKASLKEAVNG